MWFLFLTFYSQIVPNLLKEKSTARCVASNVVSGTAKYVLVRKARGSLFVVDATNQNCKEFSNYLNNYNIEHSNTKKIRHIHQATQNMLQR